MGFQLRKARSRIAMTQVSGRIPPILAPGQARRNRDLGAP